MLSIAILHYNNEVMTDKCVNNIRDQHIPFPHEIFVLDNGSQKPYKEQNLQIYREPKNRGVVGGVNACFERAKYDWVLYVSNDVIFKEEDAIWTLFKRGHTDSVQAMPVILTPDGGTDSVGMDLVWPGYGFSRHRWKGPETPIIPNITFLCHRALWLNAGKFDEEIKMGYEDVDFGLRLKGRKIVVKDAVVTHMGNATLKKTLNSHREVYRESRRYVIKKNYSGLDRWLRLAIMSSMDTTLNIVHKAAKVIC